MVFSAVLEQPRAVCNPGRGSVIRNAAELDEVLEGNITCLLVAGTKSHILTGLLPPVMGTNGVSWVCPFVKQDCM